MPLKRVRGARFGPFEVDATSAKLKKMGIRLHVREKSLEVLGLLLKHPGEIVTRAELREGIWPANGLTNIDNSLNTAIGRLREVLGDSAGSAKYVETLPGRGYRFVARVSFPLPDVGRDSRRQA